MPHLSTGALIEELQLLAWRLHRIPRAEDMQQIGRYSTETYLNRFGTWNQALEASGLADRREPSLSHTRLQRYLQELGEQVGRTPTRVDIQEQGELSPWVYVDRFDSWLGALDQAGFTTEPRTSPAKATVSHETLRTTLTMLADEIGRTPSQDELDTYGDYTSTLYQAAFGSWDDALQLAGLADHSLHGAPTYSTKELLAALRELATEREQVPTAQDMNTYGKHAAKTYQDRFGTWTNALQQAGLTPTSTDSLPTTAELLTELQRLTEKHNRPPTPAEMRCQGKYSPDTYLVRFDAWDQAVKEAGYDPANAWERS